MVVAPDRPTPGDPPPRQPVDQTDLQDGDIQKEVEEEVREPVTDGPPMSISIGKLSAITGLSRSLLYARAHAGDLPGCRRLGSRFLIHLETFEDYLKSGNGQSDTPRKPRKPRTPAAPKVIQEVEKTKAPFWRILGI